ncbi:MAG: ferrochelatase [Gammaproteobacteria bacterium]|nr:ferrochelatase [Gammaproteobacteria bacterium]
MNNSDQNKIIQDTIAHDNLEQSKGAQSDSDQHHQHSSHQASHCQHSNYQHSSCQNSRQNNRQHANDKTFRHDFQPRLGVLITNLGTPDAPTSSALRAYLKQFLWDHRVVDYPRLLWWFILQVILLIRPAKSAQTYQKIWTKEGSPLLSISINQLQGLRSTLKQAIKMPHRVELGMRYGNPSIPSALEKLREANATHILVLPLYPQYSSSTTASTFDAVAQAVKDWRYVPEFRFINSYHDNPGYVDALATSIQENWQARQRPDILLFSFHGTPKRFLTTGDPYYCQCHKTARLVAEKLQLQQDQWQLTFQSIFGREEWLQPYTIETLKSLGGEGNKKVDVVCPGFSADCLETIEEIDQENREAFIAAGGKDYHYIPALNDRDDHIEALCNIVLNNIHGWNTEWEEGKANQENQLRVQQAKALGARQ